MSLLTLRAISPVLQVLLAIRSLILPSPSHTSREFSYFLVSSFIQADFFGYWRINNKVVFNNLPQAVRLNEGLDQIWSGAGFITSGVQFAFTIDEGLPETTEYGGILSATNAPPRILLPRPMVTPPTMIA